MRITSASGSQPRRSGLQRTLVVAAVIAGIAACEGTIGDAGQPLSASGSGSTGGAGGVSVDGGDAGAFASSYLPARIRRLTNAEFDNSTSALLGTTQQFASTFNADVRQGSYNAGGFPAAGFTRNASAIFDAVSTPQIEAAADSLASEAVTKNLAQLAPCSDSNPADLGCATTFINTFGAQAYRRPVTTTELNGLLTVYQTGITDQNYAGGIQLVITTILQSAGFLYLTELGDGTSSGGITPLSSYEVASELSYFITGGPPDATLIQAAAANTLQNPSTVAQQATRLLAMPAARAQLATFVEQWLGIDTPPGTTTGLMVSGHEMVEETTELIGDVMFNGDGTLASMLTANYTFVDSNLAQLYGLVPDGGPLVAPDGGPLAAPDAGAYTRVSTDGLRTGLLNQGSFLTYFAHGDMSAPVKRGHLVRTQMLCQVIPPPDPSLMVNTTPPTPTANETTREAEQEHMTNPACAACHTLMDPIGFGFENFDGNAAYRTTENGQPIDSSGTINNSGSTGGSGSFANGPALVSMLAQNSVVDECYLSHFADYASAATDPGIEDTFLNFWAQQPATVRINLPQLIVAFVQSDLFLKRSVQ